MLLDLNRAHTHRLPVSFPLSYFLHPTAMMNTIPTVPTACVTTIASCRAVIWLTTRVKPDESGYVLSVKGGSTLWPAHLSSIGYHIHLTFRWHLLAGVASKTTVGDAISQVRLATSAYLRAYTKAEATKKEHRPRLSDLTFYIRELFARTRQNDEGVQVMRSSPNDPPNFRTPTSPSYWGPTSVTHLTQPEENQAGVSGPIASSTHLPDKSSPLFTIEGYSPYEDRGRRAISPDSSPSTGNEDGPTHERYRMSYLWW